MKCSRVMSRKLSLLKLARSGIGFFSFYENLSVGKCGLIIYVISLEDNTDFSFDFYLRRYTISSVYASSSFKLK